MMASVSSPSQPGVVARLLVLAVLALCMTSTSAAVNANEDAEAYVPDDWQPFRPAPVAELGKHPFCVKNCTDVCFARCPAGRFVLPRAQEGCAQDCFDTCTGHCNRNTTVACYDVCLGPCIDSDCRQLNVAGQEKRLISCATKSCSSDCIQADQRCMTHMLYQVKKSARAHGCEEGSRLGEDGTCKSLAIKELTLDEELIADGWAQSDISSVESALSFGLSHKIIQETMQMTIFDKTQDQIGDLMNKLTGREQAGVEERLLMREFRGCNKLCRNTCRPPTGTLPATGPGWRNNTLRDCKWDCYQFCSDTLQAGGFLCHERCMGMKEHPNSFALKEWCDGWCWPVSDDMPGNIDDFIADNKPSL